MARVRLALDALAAVCAVGLLSEEAAAADLLGFYVGAGAGRAHVRADDVAFVDATGSSLGGPISLSEHHTGWKLLAGVRPVSLVGAELEYIDFGNSPTSSTPTGFGLGYTANVRAKATTALGVLYAPIPVPLFDVYGKAGLARLQSTVDASAGLGCFGPLKCPVIGGTFHRDETTTRFAYGAGAQMKLGHFAIRAEYERITASEGSPDLLSLSLAWSF